MSNNNIPKNIESEIEKLTAEIDTLSKQKSYGIKPDELTAYIDNEKKSWSFKSNTSSRKQRLQVAQIKDELMKTLDSLDANTDVVSRLTADDSATKKLLELVLNDFNYDDLCDKQNIDPVMLTQLASEIYTFLVVIGGRAGQQFSQMQQKLDTLNHLLILKDSQKNGQSSSVPKTE